MDQEAGGPARCPHLDRAISPVQAARFVLGMRNGETVAGAAAGAGVAVQTLYYRRRIDAEFAGLWADAKAGASEDVAAARAAERAARSALLGTAPRRHEERKLVRKHRRAVEFDRERKQRFLDHFAATCNLEASAATAGVSVSSVYRALRSDAAFTEGFEEALQFGYRCLEAEALREQREAQRAYVLNPGDTAGKAQSFERTMQLLKEYKRAAGPSSSLRTGGTIGRRSYRSRARWTFDETIDAIEQKLKAFGVEIVDSPQEETDPHPNQHRVNVAPRRSGHAGDMTDPMLPQAGEGVSDND